MDDDIPRQLEARRYSEAFDLLFKQFKDKVFRLAFSMLSNEIKAEDITQDVFLKIWKALPAYHGGASLSTWIYTITRNTCLTELTRRKKHSMVSLQEPEMEAASEGIPALRLEDPEPGAEMDVEMLLMKLPERFRQVITLFYLEQKSYEDVSLMLGIPLGTVKTLLFRAKKELLRIHAAQTRSVLAKVNSSQTIQKRNPVVVTVRSLPKIQHLSKLMLL